MVFNPFSAEMIQCCTTYNNLINVSFFSRNYVRDGAPPPYLGGCKLHGHSLEVPPESEEDDTKSPHYSGSLPATPLAARSPCDRPGDSPHSARGQTPPFDHTRCSPAMHKSCVCVNFIAEHTRAKEDATKVLLM